MDIEIQGHNLRVTEALDELRPEESWSGWIATCQISWRCASNWGASTPGAAKTCRSRRSPFATSAARFCAHRKPSPARSKPRINLAVDKMYRQIQRFKGKRIRKGRERFTATIEELNAAEAIPELEFDGEIR